jgi:hypothetical protein
VEIEKSARFNSPQLAAIRLNLSFIDTPWLAAGKFIVTNELKFKMTNPPQAD